MQVSHPQSPEPESSDQVNKDSEIVVPDEGEMSCISECRFSGTSTSAEQLKAICSRSNSVAANSDIMASVFEFGHGTWKARMSFSFALVPVKMRFLST